MPLRRCAYHLAGVAWAAGAVARYAGSRCASKVRLLRGCFAGRAVKKMQTSHTVSSQVATQNIRRISSWVGFVKVR